MECLCIDININIRCFSVLQSRDREHRKSTGKQGLDASGNLYQYDNYDEVAMDTDSETSSPGERTGTFSGPVLSYCCSSLFDGASHLFLLLY